MSGAASTNASTYTQVRIREPAGERTFGDTLSIGGHGSDVVVPGVGPGPAVRIERNKGIWLIQPLDGAAVRFDGRVLTSARDLRRHDVVAVGDAQIIVTDLSRTLVRLDVCHLVGNATVPPVVTVDLGSTGAGDEELEITVPPAVSQEPAPAPRRRQLIRAGAWRARALWRSERLRALATPGAIVLVLLWVLISQLNSVALDVEPRDARIRAPGTMLVIHAGSRLLLLPGEHTIRAERTGYVPAQARVSVGRDTSAGVRLRLAKLPGELHIDTGGIATTISIDGVESGSAPGVIGVPAGSHTITLHAPRYVDYIATLQIEGAGARQELRAALLPSWGTLQITVVPAGARISVDGADNGTAPTNVEAPSGVRHVRISAPNLKTWESSVVLKAGEVLAVGPITLGQPDAHLTLRSEPSNAEVTVDGILRGRTPLELDLPPGIQHDIVVNDSGHAAWSRRVLAEAGKQILLDAKLDVDVARVSLQGEPSDAQILIDGTDRGRTPQSFELTTIEHRIEIRKAGWVTFTQVVTPARGLDRAIHYRLLPDESASSGQRASIIYSQTGYLLRLVSLGTFSMSSDGTAEGGRPGGRPVTLKRPFYLGVTDITNEQFRRFRVDHTSGNAGRRAPDPDDQPVTQVSWEEAVRYCNWLSERDSLSPAYELTGGRYVLRRPVTMGYRLPTEAEWEYAAGQAATHISRNVSEWVNDYYAWPVNPTPATDPLGPVDGDRHVIRGADAKLASDSQRRLTRREGGVAGGTTLGFRLARYAE
jgi:Sulfatase-modifying factor enzyme 1/PEGA domain